MNHTCLVLISANAEWEAVLRRFPGSDVQQSPYGGWFEDRHQDWNILFCQGGWGKVSAAASAQYAIATWKPDLVVNLGTCGGFAGRIAAGEVILVRKTIIYDIIEKMGDMQAALDFYTVKMDFSWLAEPFPIPVRRETLVSADQDLDPEMVPLLEVKFKAAAADWESGAIAWVAERNKLPCLILRAVSDLVYEEGGEAYADGGQMFAQRADAVMGSLLSSLPAWLDCVKL
jgi:adenosylhomocysteine nucleosidase